MFSLEFSKNTEKLIGAPSQEVIIEILKNNPKIIKVAFRRYFYIPQVVAKEKSKQDVPFELDTNENFTRKLDEEIRSINPDQNLAIFSRVTLVDGSFAHIPMMDFRLSRSPQNVSLLRERLNKITNEKEGYILESDKSYHYYGMRLIRTQNEWLEFMANCLLTSVFQGEGKPFLEIADSRYIGHRLLEGGCALRISAKGGKAIVPTVVALL